MKDSRVRVIDVQGHVPLCERPFKPLQIREGAFHRPNRVLPQERIVQGWDVSRRSWLISILFPEDRNPVPLILE